MSQSMSLSQSQSSNSGVIIAGLALFSMFFGAGDLIWPLILGGASGSQNFFAVLGLLVTGVTLPLLGLIAMMLFQGNYHDFFGRIGKSSAVILIFIVQVILGPVGSIPRLMTLSYATLKPYLMEEMSLLLFCFFASILILALTMRPQKIIQILGLILTPLLLLCLFAILVIGFYNHPEAHPVPFSGNEAFFNGLQVGYNTLDLIASFIFAPLVLSHFATNAQMDNKITRKMAFIKMLKASLFAAGLLSVMYIGLTFVASYYTPLLEAGHKPEERLSLIALHLLGPYGALIACIAVAMACLTTAIPLVSIFANYLHKDLLKDKGGSLFPLIATLGLSILLANMGFMGIAKMLSPVLQILCPGLIMLSVLNIFHKLYETRVPRLPVFATFALSMLGYVF